MAITFYDWYILHPLYRKLNAVQRNSDGSTTYVPSGPAGTPAAQLNAVLVSANRQKMEERITSTMGYMSLNMINTYTSMGEDGGRGRKKQERCRGRLKKRGTSSRRSNDGTCRSCGGTGFSKTPNSGGSRTSWVAYYNSQGSKCPYCGGYTGHYHDRCSRCNVPRN